jgi:hypothetical protein
MLRSRRSLSLALLATSALVPAVAVAFDRAPDGTAKAQPNRAGAATTLVLDAQGGAAALRPGQAPSKVVLAFTRGYSFDGRAVAARCSDDQAKTDGCPARSRSGRGTVAYHVTGDPKQHTAAIGEFLAPRSHGALGDVQFVVHDHDFNMIISSRGRLVRVASGPYGAELRFQFPAPTLPSGVQLTIDRLTLRTGAHRTVTIHRRHHRSVRRTYNLVRNPPHCPSSHRWPVELRATYGSETDGRDTDIICRAH